MLAIVPHHRILLACRPVDGRKGIDALCALCRAELREDPFSGTIFLFRTRAGTSLRILLYDGVGFWLATRRFSAGRLRWWPSGQTGAVSPLAAQQLQILLYNGDPTRVDFAEPWRRVPQRLFTPPGNSAPTLPLEPAPNRSTAATPRATRAPALDGDPPP